VTKVSNINSIKLVLKSTLFCREVDFLGHHIFERSIEADPKKVKRILNWPTPKLATEAYVMMPSRFE
jgi:hypothetical protein